MSDETLQQWEKLRSDPTLEEMQKPKSLILEIIERLTRVEARLENVVNQTVTKTEFKQMETHQLKWLIGTILACFVLSGAFLKYF